MTLSETIAQHLGVPPVGIQSVVIEPGARSRLSRILSELQKVTTVAVLMDDRPYQTTNGSDVKEGILAELSPHFSVQPVTLTGDVHADEKTVDAAVAGSVGADAVVTIGSGTLCDIGKVAAGDRPHIVIQTAASVNGFADDQSVLLIQGTKRTTHSGWPHTLLIDNDVLSAAPVELNRSGLGDMISMFTAPADWYLASIFTMDRGYNPDYATMTRRYGNDLLSIASGIGSSHPTALTALAEFVTLSGISMGVAGQTSPSSGMEHTVSHLIDMSNGSRGLPNAFHGEQVGVATVLVSLLWKRIMGKIDQQALGAMVIPSTAESETAVRAAFTWMDPAGATADECWSDYAKKRDHLAGHDAPSQWEDALATWATHRDQLNELLVDPEKIVSALRAAGAPTRFSELSVPISADTVRWALTHCHLMRNRFTIADLAYLTGNWGDDDVEAVLADANALGSGL